MAFLLRAAGLLLALAAVSGLALAGIRFCTDRSSPPWLAKLHGFAAVAALTLLLLGWARGELPRAVSVALPLLLLAAVGGVVLNLGYHARRSALPEWLVFLHMSVAFVGFLVVGAVLLALPG